jgi:hypothetical protein
MLIVSLVVGLCAVLALIWWKERQIIAVPGAYYMLGQLYLINLLTHSQISQFWIDYTLRLLNSDAGLKHVPTSYFSNGFGLIGNQLWWLYLIVSWTMAVMLIRGDATDDFVGQFHPTGREYVKEWQIGRGRAPAWIASCLEEASENGRSVPKRLLGHLLQAVTRAQKVETTRYFGNSFIAYQAKVWGIMKPIAVWDPFDTISELHEVMRPEEWAFKYDIITERAKDEIIGRTQNWRQSSSLTHNYNRARRVFEAQVKAGGRWEGTYKCQPYMKAIIAICYLNRASKQDQAVQLCYTCAEAAVPLFKLRSNASNNAIKSVQDSVNQEIDQMLRGKHDNRKLSTKPFLTPAIVDETDRLLRGFWWNRTALISLLGMSGPHLRWGGGTSPILQPALFQSWVQSMDRVLYLALNCVGGETWHAECAGVIAQYQVEAVFKRTCENQIAQLERELANSRESHIFYARENNLTIEQVTGAEDLAHQQRLSQQIQDERARSLRQPALNMNGPINWLAALISKDRNEAELDFLYETPKA